MLNRYHSFRKLHLNGRLLDASGSALYLNGSGVSGSTPGIDFESKTLTGNWLTNSSGTQSNRIINYQYLTGHTASLASNYAPAYPSPSLSSPSSVAAPAGYMEITIPSVGAVFLPYYV